MAKVLIIGLNEFSKKIIKYFQGINYQVIGFDFSIDKIDLFKTQNLIDNNSKEQLSSLLKQSDFIILNLDYSKYENIFRLSPFIKNDCIITNTSTYKGDFKKYKNFLVNKADNFIPSNFLLFPEKTIINYDEDSKMNYIKSISKFYRDANLSTSILNPKENDIVFRDLFQIPALLDKILFNNDDSKLLSSAVKTEILYDDIFKNKQEIINDLEKIINSFPNLNYDDNITHFINDNKIIRYGIKTINNKIIEDNLIIKILIEKLLIKLYMVNNVEVYIDLKYLNFDYLKYESEYLKEYFIQNKNTLELSCMLIKEKLINVASFLGLENSTFDKLSKYF